MPTQELSLNAESSRVTSCAYIPLKLLVFIFPILMLVYYFSTDFDFIIVRILIQNSAVHLMKLFTIKDSILIPPQNELIFIRHLKATQSMQIVGVTKAI